jgi:hypothetical protein
MRFLPLLFVAATTYANPLNEPAKPTVPIKTSEDKRKVWKPGEAAHIQGRVIQNTGDGLLVKGSVKGVGKTAGLFFVKGAFKTNQGAGISIHATYEGEKTYTSVSESRETVPVFVPR